MENVIYYRLSIENTDSILQSVQNTENLSPELKLLERQINNLFVEVASVWRDTDIKKAQAIRLLAARMEEYFIQLGLPEEISTISSKIKEKLTNIGIATAHHVHDYLDEKYKRSYNHDQITQHGDILDKNLLALQQIDLHSLEVDAKQKAFEIMTKFTSNIEQDAQQHNYALFRQNEDTFDSTKPAEMDDTVSTYRQPPKETAFSDAIQVAIDALVELKKDAMEFPPAWEKQARIYSQGWLRFAKIIRWLTDDKFSLDAVEWFNKENYRMVQGKHAAAVHDKVETVLCIECSKDLDNDPDAYEIMYADFRSPSGWRCGRCKGTKGLERGMTREQVGDRSYYTQQWAADTIQELPWMTASLYWYRDNKKPINNARKIRLSPKLSKLA